MININLLEAPPDVELEVKEINAGTFASKRLVSMGLHTGDKLVKFGKASWGPVLIKNVSLNASKIAIGRRLANKILVTYEEA